MAWGCPASTRSGLLGLADRLAVLDGQLRIESPADGGTLLAATSRSPASTPDREPFGINR